MSDEPVHVTPERDSPQLRAAYELWAESLGHIASILIFGKGFPTPPPWEDLSPQVRRNWASINRDFRRDHASLS